MLPMQEYDDEINEEEPVDSGGDEAASSGGGADSTFGRVRQFGDGARQIGKNVGKNTAKQAGKEAGKQAAKQGVKQGARAAGAAVGSAVGPEGTLAGELAGQAIGEALTDPKKAAKYGLIGAGAGALTAVIAAILGFLAFIFFVIFPVVMVAAAVLVVVLAGGAIFGGSVGAGVFDPTPPETVIPGDGLGISSDYCQIVLSDKTAICSLELEKIFESAGAFFKVPAGVLVGIAATECSATFGLNDENVKTYSAPGAMLPHSICKDSIDGAHGPMQFMPNTWERYKNAVNIATGENRTPEVHNIKDAIYGAAWKLKCDSNHGVPQDECSSGHFTKYDYNDTTDGWEKEEEVSSAASGYLGACVDPRFPDVKYCEEVWEIYQAVKDTGTGEIGGWPVSGEISQTPYCSGSPIDCPTHQKSAAIDIGANEGTRVYSTQSGIAQKLVDKAKKGELSCGNYVQITGTNFITIYCHLSDFSDCFDADGPDGPGSEYVPAGQLIGYVGNTGTSSGPHLHYGIKDLNGQYVSKEVFDSLVPDYDLYDQVTASYEGECK